MVRLLGVQGVGPMILGSGLSMDLITVSPEFVVAVLVWLGILAALDMAANER